MLALIIVLFSFNYTIDIAPHCPDILVESHSIDSTKAVFTLNSSFPLKSSILYYNLSREGVIVQSGILKGYNLTFKKPLPGNYTLFMNARGGLCRERSYNTSFNVAPSLKIQNETNKTSVKSTGEEFFGAVGYAEDTIYETNSSFVVRNLAWIFGAAVLALCVVLIIRR